MTTDGGGWTLVAHAPSGLLPGPLGVASASLPGTSVLHADPADRSRAWSINALWLAQASVDVALSWTPVASAPRSASATALRTLRGDANASIPTIGADATLRPPAGGMGSYGAAIAFGLPAPSDTTLALTPPPLPQPCSSASGDFAPVDVRCLVLRNASAVVSGDCAFPRRMYTGTSSLGVCGGRAYGVILSPVPAELCDGPLGLEPTPAGHVGAPSALTVAGAMLGIDALADCAGVRASASGGGSAAVEGLVPAFMALWMR